jgi:uncharacterized protein YndB with AHSA1/START domain
VTTTTDPATDRPVRKSVTVKTTAEHAFRVFTEEFDSWWPRTHHIGKSPMKKAIIDGRAGGRCYSEQADGTECDWGKVLVWEPPRRLVWAWQIDSNWQYEPDLEKSSEVEVRFTPEAGGMTRVDLEHRYFARHGAGADAIRKAVDAQMGWGDLMTLFVAQAEKTA